MRGSLAPLWALSCAWLTAAAPVAAAPVTLTYRDLRYVGEGFVTGDPPPPGFGAALAGQGPLWAQVVYDDAPAPPTGPGPGQPPVYRFDALRSITIAMGPNVYETRFEAGAPGPIRSLNDATTIGTRYDAQGEVDSGPTVLGLQPVRLDFSWAGLAAAPDSLPSAESFRSAMLSAGVRFRTPLGNPVEVQLWPALGLAAPVTEPAPALAMGLGAWLVWQAHRRQRRA